MPDSSDTPLISALSDQSDMIDLIELYVMELPDRLAAIRSAQQRDALVELAELAHQLNGSGGSHGFGLLSEIAAELEQAARDQARPRVEFAIVRLHRAVHCIRTAYPQVT